MQSSAGCRAIGTSPVAIRHSGDGGVSHIPLRPEKLDENQARIDDNIRPVHRLLQSDGAISTPPPFTVFVSESSSDTLKCILHILVLMMNPVTELLNRLNSGDRGALDELIPLVYQELHKIAEGYFRRETPGHTLQPTSLIHEAYLRLVKQPHPEYQSRAHFYGVAARVMRQILVDHARSRRAAKRGAGETISLGENPDVASSAPVGVLAIDEALERLAGIDKGKVDLVEMRFFGGMTAEEIAECSAMPVHTVRRQLRLAQAWLHKELNP